MKQHYWQLLFLLLIFFFPVLAQAQDPNGDPTQAAPIDGGVSLLIAAGVGYGVKKYRDGRKKQKQEDEKKTEV